MQSRWYMLVLLALISRTGWGADVRALVDGETQRCQVFLKTPEPGTIRNLIFYVQGTGFSSASEPLHPLAKYWFHAQRMAVLTYEKPGIEKRESRWSADIHTFQEHTPNDLLACAINALLFAETSLPHLEKIFFLGHSAGGEVLLRTYDELYRNFPALAAKVKLIQLTNPLLGGWRELADFQLKTEEGKAAFEKALADKNEDYFQKNGNVPYAFWQKALELSPAGELVKDLPSRPVSLHIYQGRQDSQISPKALKDLETWVNASNPRMKKINIHWFDASHALEEAHDSVIPLMIENTGTEL